MGAGDPMMQGATASITTNWPIYTWIKKSFLQPNNHIVYKIQIVVLMRTLYQWTMILNI